VPFYLNVAETVPALMAGNTVVLKPAQLTPWSGSEYGRIVAEETDIPAGVFNVVVSNANEAGAALSADPRIDMITFTGSTATGRAILAAGASTVKKTLLELGGKSAHVVLDDADFNSALPMAAMMACVMSGQSCILPSRILLPRSRYDEGLAILKGAMENFPVGDPWTPGNMQGPQISETQRQKVLGLIKSGIDSGARLVTGGGVPENLPTGYYVQPTLLADVDPDSQVAKEEIFGPVLTVTAYDTDDDAVAIANNTIYGLSGEVSSADVDRAFEVAKRMRTGNVTINGRSHFGIGSPFGGTKQSGLGYRNGEEGYKESSRPRRSGCPIDGRGRRDAYIDYSPEGAATGSPTTNWSARRMGGAVVTSARRTCGSSTRRPALRNHICDSARVASDNIGTCRRRMPPFDDGGQTPTAGDGTALRADAVSVATRTHDRR
jgi:aldehyde dehydrogenase (NAD+)